ncbi:MAG: hypothetical protein DYH15_14330 [Nitrosomonas sp. PRO4]|nr:hypothetical protein [Nitrosomonas sp. PRO4]
MNVVTDILEVERLKNVINLDAHSIGKENLVFREIHNTPSSFTCFEAGFLKILSWLYMLYYESARGEIEFIIEKFPLYKIDSGGNSLSHYKDIRTLRTAFQHNFDPNANRNTTLRTTTEKWFIKAAQKNLPETNDDWEKSLIKILVDSAMFLTDLHNIILLMKNDDFKDKLVEDWNKKSSRNFQSHDFDPVIQIVLQEFGMIHFDSLRFRKQNSDLWIQELRQLTGNFDFSAEARKLIERDILTKPVLPITGSDIIEIFGIQPGLRVKETMELARKIYLHQPCNREELIKKIISYSVANQE